MNQPDKRIDLAEAVPNNLTVVLAITGSNAVTDAASGAGLDASHRQLILP